MKQDAWIARMHKCEQDLEAARKNLLSATMSGGVMAIEEAIAEWQKASRSRTRAYRAGVKNGYDFGLI